MSRFASEKGLLMGRVLLAMSVVFAAGCQSLAVRSSFVRWNIQSAKNGSCCVEKTPLHAIEQRALKLASCSEEDLDTYMKQCRAPEFHELVGTWHGINKGLGPALANITQDVKVFHECSSGSLHGFNRLVEQVPLDELSCRGWQAKRRLFDDSTIEVGRFQAHRVNSKCGSVRLTLDYRSHNPPWDPTRYLYDELVLVDQDLVLGRAYAQAGAIRIPIAYFVLFREESVACDACDELPD